MDSVAPEATDTMLETLFSGIAQLERFPEIAKGAEEAKYRHLSELFIPFGANGYSVLYEFKEKQDIVLITAIMHTKEKGFKV